MQARSSAIEIRSSSAQRRRYTTYKQLSVAEIGDRVSKDDAGAATSDEVPDAALGVQERELERGAGLLVELLDEALLARSLPTKHIGELEIGPTMSVL